MFTVDEMLSKAISHKAIVDSTRKDVADNRILIEEKTKRLESLNELVKNTKFSVEYLDKLIKEESGKFIKRLNGVLDYGIKTVFDDCEYSIEIRVSDNDKATIHLVYDSETGDKIEPNVQQCGGGIRTVVGILAQIYFIFFYKVEPIIFIDEGLSQLSSRYVPNLMSLIKELADKNGLKILLITHDDRFLQYATQCYEIDNGKAVLIDSGGVA